MTKTFTLLDFSCLPLIDSTIAILVTVAMVIIIVSALIAMYIYPNRRESVITAVGVTAVFVTVITVALIAFVMSFKCDVILADGTRQVETQVATYRYPELGMEVVLIPRGNNPPLMNKFHSGKPEETR
ncbi:hypothetical protein D9M68_19570 [compost metagenome]